MTLKLSAVRWVHVIVLAVLIYLVSFVLIFAVITSYATILGFQARGAPDPAQITQFANQVAPSAGRLGVLVLTFGAAAWLARRPNVSGPVNGLVLGILAGLPNLVRGSLDVGAIATALLAVAVGWLGGTIGPRGTTPTSLSSKAG